MTDRIHFTLGHKQYTKDVQNAYAGGVISLSDDGQHFVLSDDGEVGYIIHNPSGAAIEQPECKRLRWMRFGQPHRVDGPWDIQEETEEIEGYEEYAVFGLPLSKDEFEEHNDFIKRAVAYIDEHNFAVLEADGLDTSDTTVRSFDSLEDFLRAARTNTLDLDIGPRDLRTHETIKLPDASSGMSGGAAVALGLIAGGILVASSLSGTTQKRAAPAINEVAHGR